MTEGRKQLPSVWRRGTPPGPIPDTSQVARPAGPERVGKTPALRRNLAEISSAAVPPDPYACSRRARWVPRNRASRDAGNTQENPSTSLERSQAVRLRVIPFG